jgi:hypothetical protein
MEKTFVLQVLGVEIMYDELLWEVTNKHILICRNIFQMFNFTEIKVQIRTVKFLIHLCSGQGKVILTALACQGFGEIHRLSCLLIRVSTDAIIYHMTFI